MFFGKKSQLLINLIQRTQHENKANLIRSLKKNQGSKRDVFSHSYIGSDSENVLFIERSRGREYVATEHPFTIQEFREHVAEFVRNAQLFQTSLAVSDGEFLEFTKAALSANSKPTTSLGKPS